MTTFKLDPNAGVNGTHGLGEIQLIPSRLVEQFGRPGECDGYKVSGSYRFSDNQGRPYTLYDWKLTSLYFDTADELGEPTMPTPQEFWASETPRTLSIGGRDECDVPAFKSWLNFQVGSQTGRAFSDAGVDRKPFMELPGRRDSSIVWLPDDLRNFYATREGFGRESSPDRPVRLCKLGELAMIQWQDLHVFGQCGRRVGVGLGDSVGNEHFFDEIFYVLKCPAAPAGSIMAFGVDISGPGGTDDETWDTSLVLARDFQSWIARLEEDAWHEYGLVPAEIDKLPAARQQELQQHFLSLNPGIDWGTK